LKYYCSNFPILPENVPLCLCTVLLISTGPRLSDAPTPHHQPAIPFNNLPSSDTHVPFFLRKGDEGDSDVEDLRDRRRGKAESCCSKKTVCCRCRTGRLARHRIQARCYHCSGRSPPASSMDRRPCVPSLCAHIEKRIVRFHVLPLTKILQSVRSLRVQFE
jgi:hypothetical protein